MKRKAGTRARRAAVSKTAPRKRAAARASSFMYEGGEEIVVGRRLEAKALGRHVAEESEVILRTAMDGFWIVDTRGRFLEANEAYCNLIGYTLAELLGMAISDIEAAESQEAITAHIATLMRTGSERFTTRHRRKDGVVLDVEVSANYLPRDGRFFVFVRDVTERQRLQAELVEANETLERRVAARTAELEITIVALRESEERFRSMSEASLEGLMIHVQGVILDVNLAFARLFGYEQPEELLGLNGPELLLTHESRARVLQRMERQEQGLLEVTGLRKDGTTFAAETDSRPLKYRGRAARIVSMRDITERKRAADALHESEARFRSLFNAAADAILVMNAEVFLDCNASAEAMFGCRKEDLVGQSPVAFSPREQPDGQLSSRKGPTHISAALGGAPQSFDWKHRRADGTLFDAEVRLNRVELSGVMHLQAIVRDVSHRKQADEEIRRSQIEYKALFESANDPIIIFEPEAEIILEANERACSTYGFSRDELLGTSLKALTKDVARGERVLRELMRAGTVTDLETTHFRKDGTQIDVLVSASVIDFKGRRAIQTITRDITKRRLADEALRLHSAALNAAANAIVITALDGTIEWVNAAFSALSGYSAEEAVGRNPRDLVKSGAHEPAFYKRMWDTLLAGDVWSGEMTNRRKDGGVYAEEMTITPVRGVDGQVGHFIAIKRDLTEQRELAAQFLQAQKMEIVGRLAGGVAHDFNNLLTIINATAELAADGLKPDDPLRIDFQEISRAGERAEGLTRQLLAFSRKQVMQPRILNLSTHVAGLQRMLQRLVGEDVALVIVPAERIGGVMADPGQIEQVILHLVVNARDAMPGGGTLTIEAWDVTFDEIHEAQHLSLEPGSYVMLAISDTGVGMDDATRTRIFEPFFTTKGPDKGTGLGLSTVFGIVQQSGGGIWVSSEVGKGTTFKVYLPRVEDDSALRRLTQRVLESAGFAVLVAASGSEALQLLDRHDGLVDLMLTDVVMPGMNGPELAARAAEARPLMKVLYTSGYTDLAIVRHGILDTGRYFISKPYATGELTRKVLEVLDS